SIEYLKNQPAFALKRVGKHGNIFKSSIFGRKCVFVTGVDALKKIIKLESNGTIAIRPVTPGLQVFGPNSMLSLNGTEHDRLRRLLYSAFSRDTLMSCLPFILDTAKEACAKFEGRGYFPMHKEFKRFALRVTASAVLGMESQRSWDEVLELLITMGLGIYSLTDIRLPFTDFGKAMDSREELLDIIADSIREMEAGSPEDGAGVRVMRQILDARDEDGNGLEMPVILDNLILILWA
ncbi:unnamed protein product, partial [Ostreobium quekettii]